MLSSKHYDDNDMPRSPPLGGAEERTSEDRVRGSEDDGEEGRKTSGEVEEPEEEEDLDLAEEEMRGGVRQKGQGTAEKAGVILVSRLATTTPRPLPTHRETDSLTPSTPIRGSTTFSSSYVSPFPLDSLTPHLHSIA